MAQRSFSCPSCGGDVYIPDNYFKAGVLCGHCGTAVNRLDGEPYEGDTEGLDTAATEPPPAEPAASSRGARSKRLVPVMVIAVVLVVGAVGAMLIFGPGDDEAAGGFEWSEYESEEGGYAATFPADPRSLTESVQLADGNTTFHKMRAHVSGTSFEVGYFDARDNGEAAANQQMRELLVNLAEDLGGAAEGAESMQVSGVDGLRAEVPMDGGRRSTLLAVRAPHRFFVAAVEGHTDDDAEFVERFLQSLELVPAVTDPTPMSVQAMFPAYFHALQKREPYIEITGGSGPFRVDTSSRLPSGWRGVIEARRYVLQGAPDAPGVTPMTFTITDAYGQSVDVQQDLRVVPSTGPVEFGDSFITGGMVGVPYEGWVRIENHLPGLVEYEATWSDPTLPEGLIPVHLTEDADIAEAGLEPGYDYVVITGEPRRPGTGSCTVVIAAEAPDETVKTPERRRYTIEVTVESNED